MSTKSRAGRSEWAKVSLGEILNKEQLKKVAEILNGKQSLEKQTQTLKNYLKQFSAELEAKGINSDYLAYAIVFHAGKGHK